MSTRRDALRILSGASATLPIIAATSGQETKEVGDQPGHLHTGPAIKVPQPSQPTFLQPAEMKTVEALAERIIPKSDTPGAKEAGVPLLIDKALVANPLRAPAFRAGLADLNVMANGAYGNDFAALTEQQQVELLTPMSLDVESETGRFFTLAKGMTVDAYYKTEPGLKTELGWHGNTYLASFPGCDHPEHQT